MSDELDAARVLLPGIRLDRAETLRGGERTAVHRVRATGPDGAQWPLIVKRYLAAGEGWVRESAALSVLPPAVAAPRIVATGSAPPVLVTDDLGPGRSVAHALLGDNAEAAAVAVEAWARTMAVLHVATRDSRAAFRAALDERQGDLPVAESRVGVDLEDAVRVLDHECGALGVRVPSGAFEELRGLAKRLGATGPAALTPADACPDNNVRTATGLGLVDFEAAQWRHVAWDVAYLRVPWPTCWCSWRLPDQVADRAVAAYRRLAGATVAAIADDAFERDVDAAAVGWALLSTTWFIGNAFTERRTGTDPDKPTPTRRAMILHRLDGAARSVELPALAELAAGLGAELHRRWGDVPLALAPAFAGAQ
jgi:hypothetical protein